MYREFNHRLIFRIIGGLLLFEGVFILSAILVAWIYHEQQITHFIIASCVSLILGFTFFLFGKNASPHIGKREGSVIVTSIWVFFTLIGLLPYWLSGVAPSLTDAFFETMSGFTTTGATIFEDVEILPHSILYWRSLTQWIGGLGIIVISMALLPIFGFSTIQLFSAEFTGPTKDKLHPKISETARTLLSIYIVLTILEIGLLIVAGMGWFDAINHSLTTMASGGFSTKQASIGYWESPAIEYIVMIFMLFSGINFSMFYFLVHGKFSKIKNNNELRFLLFIIVSFALIFVVLQHNLYDLPNFSAIEKTIRKSLFTVISTVTTTGFVIFDYTNIHHAAWILIVILMLMGASAGSTSGGMKQIRVLLVLKYAYYEFKRIIHPNAIFPVKYNNQIVREDVITRLLAFIVLYMLVIFTGTIVLSLTGMGFVESYSGMIACISDVGPGLGDIGPMATYASIPTFSKWFLSFIMLVGRLEIFTVLIIFTPIFWKR